MTHNDCILIKSEKNGGEFSNIKFIHNFPEVTSVVFNISPLSTRGQSEHLSVDNYAHLSAKLRIETLNIFV